MNYIYSEFKDRLVEYQKSHNKIVHEVFQYDFNQPYVFFIADENIKEEDMFTINDLILNDDARDEFQGWKRIRKSKDYYVYER